MPQEPSAPETYGRDFPAGAVAFEEGRGARLRPAGGLGAAAELRHLANPVDLTPRFDSEERSRS